MVCFGYQMRLKYIFNELKSSFVLVGWVVYGLRLKTAFEGVFCVVFVAVVFGGCFCCGLFGRVAVALFAGFACQIMGVAVGFAVAFGLFLMLFFVGVFAGVVCVKAL